MAEKIGQSEAELSPSVAEPGLSESEPSQANLVSKQSGDE